MKTDRPTGTSVSPSIVDIQPARKIRGTRVKIQPCKPEVAGTTGNSTIDSEMNACLIVAIIVKRS